MNITELFKQQIASGATDNFFYGTEINGEVRIERHRGPIQTLVLDELEFDRMMGSTPFFRPCEYDEQGGERGWASLTRDEVLDIEEKTKHPLEFARAIEAKLKEKNQE